jgi:hypothetical protein
LLKISHIFNPTVKGTVYLRYVILSVLDFLEGFDVLELDDFLVIESFDPQNNPKYLPASAFSAIMLSLFRITRVLMKF